MTSVDRGARVVFAALVLASFAAFFVTQRLKHTPTVVQRFFLIPFFSPTPEGHNKQERISFRIKQDDEVTVTILNSSEQEVATIVRDRPLARYTQLPLQWNGRLGSTESGPLAPAGEYRVRVTLRRQNRSVISPKSFKLVLKPRRPASSGSSSG